MAKQLNTEIKGRIGDYSFYHDRLHGYLVRRTGGVTSKQYHSDDRYAAARDASSEFSIVSGTGKLIREALAPFIKQVKDGSMVNRLNKELVVLKQSDNKHSRGQRRPETMMTDTDANKWLRIFQFNENVKTYNISRHAINRVPTDMMIKLQPNAFPQCATHAGVTLIRTVIDFEKNEFNTSCSQMMLVSRENPVEVSSTIKDLPTGKGIEITCLQVLFFSEKQGKLTALKEKVHAMGIIEIKELPINLSLKKKLRYKRKNHKPFQVSIRTIKSPNPIFVPSYSLSTAIRIHSP